MRTPLLALAAPAALVLGSGCHINFDGIDSYYVDGVRLGEEHEEVLELTTWSEQGLSVAVNAGDVEILHGAGPTRIEAQIHEVSLGDGYLEYRDGKLVVETHSGEPAVLGKVTVWTDQPLTSLHASSGMGDVVVEDVAVNGELSLSTGAGDISVELDGAPTEASASTGMGDIRLVAFDCTALDASTGMGDVYVRSVESQLASLSSGMGDVEVHGSRFVELDASTGMGDVDVIETDCEHADLDSGLGSVTRTRTHHEVEEGETREL